MKKQLLATVLVISLMLAGCNTAQSVKREEAPEPDIAKFMRENNIIAALDIEDDGVDEYIARYAPGKDAKPVIFTQEYGRFTEVETDMGFAGKTDAEYEPVGIPAVLRIKKASYLFYSMKIIRTCGKEQYPSGGLILAYKYDGRTLAFAKGFVHDEQAKGNTCYSGGHEGFEKIKIDAAGMSVSANAGNTEILVYAAEGAKLHGLIDSGLKYVKQKK